MTPRKKYAVKRTVSSLKQMIIHWISASIFMIFIIKHYVISNGGTWPTGVDQLSYIKDLIADFGGLGVIVSLITVVYEVFFKGGRSTDE